MKRRFGIIYKATDPAGKSYIGQTVKRLEQRKAEHWRESTKKDTAFYRKIRWEGINHFDWTTLYTDIPLLLIDQTELFAMYLYDTYENGYNESYKTNQATLWRQRYLTAAATPPLAGLARRVVGDDVGYVKFSDLKPYLI